MRKVDYKDDTGYYKNDESKLAIKNILYHLEVFFGQIWNPTACEICFHRNHYWAFHVKLVEIRLTVIAGLPQTQASQANSG